MSQSLSDIKANYLSKFYVVAEGENRIPNLGDNKENSFNGVHIDFVNVLLKAGLSDLQIGIFKNILDDVCVASKIKEHASMCDMPIQKEGYIEEYKTVQEELTFLVKMLETMDIKDLTFDGVNESGWLFFARRVYDDTQRIHTNVGHVIYGDIPSYFLLVTNFLKSYLRCANAFHIMLYRKATSLAVSSSVNVDENDEEAIFYMEAHNFLMELLRRFSFLNYDYNKTVDFELVREIENYTKLLNLVSLIFDETITDEQKKEFVELVHNSSIASLNFGSYFRKWLYKKAAAYEENISR